MKTAVNIAAGLITLAGSVFFLQGINVLPGSYMTGQVEWAVIGGIMIALGAGTLFFTRRRP
jgi:hypothetical protein